MKKVSILILMALTCSAYSFDLFNSRSNRAANTRTVQGNTRTVEGNVRTIEGPVREGPVREVPTNRCDPGPNNVRCAQGTIPVVDEVQCRWTCVAQNPIKITYETFPGNAPLCDSFNNTFCQDEYKYNCTIHLIEDYVEREVTAPSHNETEKKDYKFVLANYVAGEVLGAPAIPPSQIADLPFDKVSMHFCSNSSCTGQEIVKVMKFNSDYIINTDLFKEFNERVRVICRQ